jgi:hypothetical protein
LQALTGIGSQIEFVEVEEDVAEKSLLGNSRCDSMEVSGAGGGSTTSAGAGASSTSITGAGSGTSLGPQATRPATKTNAVARATAVDVFRYITISFSDRVFVKSFRQAQEISLAIVL